MNPYLQTSVLLLIYLCILQNTYLINVRTYAYNVIFNTTKTSLHGHPEPLNVPDHISRESIAVYYYTKNVNNLDFEGEKERSTMIFNIDNFDKSNIVSI